MKTPQMVYQTNAEPLARVLTWIKSGTIEVSPTPGVPGATPLQQAYIDRLSALILKRLEPSRVPPELLEALHRARKIETPREVLVAFECLISDDPIASLAHLYATLVSAENRRTLGTFFTPRNEANAMVAEYADKFDAPSRVVDIGAGVGVFSEAAQAQWPKARIDAVDINPVTLGLQALALRTSKDQSVNLFLSDFSRWIGEAQQGGPILYLGNPPYTRWQLIPFGDRERLLKLSGGLVSARANLSTIFLAIVLKRLRPHDSLCLIVPASWMEARYAKKLRIFIRELTSRSVTLRFADSWRFESAIVDAVVVEVGPEMREPQKLTIADWPGTTAAAQPRAANDDSSIPRLFDSASQSQPPVKSAGIYLGDIAQVTRGVATGSNAFFIFDADEIVAQRLNPRWLTPLARRLKGDDDPANPIVERAFLLDLAGYQVGTDAALDSLIENGESRAVNEGHLCSQRRRWFDLSREVKRPEVILTSLGRDRFHVYENHEELAITNNLFGIHWMDGVADDHKARVLDWLRGETGQEALIESSTTEANGLHRLSPRALKAITVPVAPVRSVGSHEEDGTILEGRSM